MTSASDDGAALAATRKPPRPTTTTWCTTCLRAGRGLQRAPRLSSVALPAPMVIASSGPCRRARASGSAVCSPRRRCPPSPLLRFSGLGSDVSLVPRAGLGAFAGSLPAFRSRRAAMHVSSRLLASGALAALERLLGALLPVGDPYARVLGSVDRSALIECIARAQAGADLRTLGLVRGARDAVRAAGDRHRARVVQG